MSDVHQRDPIEILMHTIRGTRSDMLEIFTLGWCYHIFLMIRAIYPEAEPWYQTNPGHIYTKVGDYWYDIRGRYSKCPEGASRMDAKNWPSHAPHRWSKQDDIQPICDICLKAMEK